MMKPIIVEQILDASPDVVWRAITDKDEMKKWYFAVSDFSPEIGFEFTFEGKSDKCTYVHHCRIIDIVPERKLTYTWSYEGYEGLSFLTFELLAEGDKIRLKLTHEGLETFPQDDPDFARESFEGGWDYFIRTSLPKFLKS